MGDSKSATLPQKCLACHAELSTPVVCEGCHRLYPLAKEVDHFALLQLERQYDLDPAVLNQRFLSLSRHVHPDFFAEAGDEMRRLSTRLSAEINDAYKVLKDPVLRASYLLETCGGPSASDDRTVPPDVLGEAMMLREEIDEATEAKNDGQIAALRDQIQQRRDTLTEQIAVLARKLPSASQEEMTELRHKINSVKYYTNMINMLWTE